MNLTQLKALKAREFVVGDDAQRDRLAQSMLACLGDLNPVLRDDISFEAYVTWLRGNNSRLQRVSAWCCNYPIFLS